MSLSDRRTVLTLLAAIALALPGCGYTPVYGTGGSAAGLRGTVRVADPDSKDTFRLAGRLEERLGRVTAVRYALDYSVTHETEGLGITPDQSTTRYNILGTARYSLTEIGTGAVIAAGQVDSFTAYSAAGTTVATSSARDDALERLMVILADQIVTRLLAAAERSAP